jgi:hypothetical protein
MWSCMSWEDVLGMWREPLYGEKRKEDDGVYNF